MNGTILFFLLLAPDQLKILREAFAKTMSDREFLAEAKTRNLEIKPTAAEKLEKSQRTSSSPTCGGNQTNEKTGEVTCLEGDRS